MRGPAAIALALATLVGLSLAEFAGGQTAGVDDAGGVLERFGDPAAARVVPAPWDGESFAIADGEVVVFAGQTNLAREQAAGHLEGLLAMAYADARPVFRSMAWEADTVFEQWRDLNFGTWNEQLRTVGATMVVAQFGQIEALAGMEDLPRFLAAYHRLLDQFAAVTPRLVLISPMPFETPQATHAPDLRARNDEVRAYAEAIRALARQRGALFVDGFTPLVEPAGRLTENGLHLTPDGLAKVARLIAGQLGVAADAPPVPEAMRAAIADKNRLWFDSWRPANWNFVYGDRMSQRFAQGSGGGPGLRETFEAHKPLIAALDGRIHALALGELPPPPPTAPPVAAFQPNPVPTPEEQLASFTLAEGYEIQLFAAEDLGVVKPVQMTWDENGRLWVACSPTYPHTLPGVPPTDFILVLEDTDGDGRADRSHRFAEGLTMVQGLELGRGGLYVCDFDRIIHLRDTSGDQRADQLEIVVSGFGIGDTHQLVNSISYGPDGSLWFTQGLHAFSRVETPWGISRLDKAGVWRMNPRTLRLDGFFNGGTAGHNCWGVVFDDYHQMFHKSGDRPHGYYSLPGLVRLADPDDYHSVANLFGSGLKTTAIDIIGTRALPDEVQGAAVIGGYFGSSVEWHRLTDDGSGFGSEPMPSLLNSSSPHFRPVDVSVGPDGAIYLADWFNPVIGHYQASYADPDRDRTHGRIWRISASGRSAVRQPDLAGMSAGRLLDQLASPERWTRYQARRLLFDAPSGEVLAAADAWLAGLDLASPDDERLLLEVAGIFEAHQSPRPELLAQLAAAKDPRVRAYGARVAGGWGETGHLQAAIDDEHPRVRLEAVVASAGLDSPEALAIALRALDHPRDRFLDYALKHAIRSGEATWPAAQGVKDPAHLAYLRQVAGGAAAPPPPGKVIYDAVCSNCHQPDGRGLAGVYPPLGPGGRTAGDPESLIKILLHGLAGAAAPVDGGPSPPPMPPMGLDDQQTAEVLSFIRSQFGNDAPPIGAAEVATVRAATADRTTFWTAGELGK